MYKIKRRSHYKDKMQRLMGNKGRFRVGLCDKTSIISLRVIKGCIVNIHEEIIQALHSV